MKAAWRFPAFKPHSLALYSNYIILYYINTPIHTNSNYLEGDSIKIWPPTLMFNRKYSHEGSSLTRASCHFWLTRKVADCLFNVIHDKFESLLCSGEKHPKGETWRRCKKRWWRGQNSAGVNNSCKFSNIGQPSTILVTLGITTFVHDSVEGQIWSLVKGSLSRKIAPKAIWAGCSCIQPSEEEPQDWPADRTQVGHCHGVCLHCLTLDRAWRPGLKDRWGEAG